jgi:hypothetical protein
MAAHLVIFCGPRRIRWKVTHHESIAHPDRDDEPPIAVFAHRAGAGIINQEAGDGETALEFLKRNRWIWS